MTDDARDIYLLTVTSRVSFTFSSADQVREAAHAVLNSEKFSFMPAADLR